MPNEKKPKTKCVEYLRHAEYYDMPVSYTHLDVYKRQGVDSAQGDNDFAPLRNIFNEWLVRDTSKKIKAVKRSKGCLLYTSRCV